MSRRVFLQGSTLVLAGLPLLACTPSAGLPTVPAGPGRLRLGLLTDIHVAPGKAPAGTRHYPDSPAKVQAALDWLTAKAGQQPLDRLVQLGDLIDGADTAEQDAALIRQTVAQLAMTGWPLRHITGNHCQVALSKAQWCAAVGQSQTTFSESVKGWRLIGLDACHRHDGTPYGDGGPRDWTDSAVPPMQLAWLARELEQSSGPAILFIHQPLAGFAPGHGVVNQAAARAVLKPHAQRIAAVFQGHTHQNAVHTVDGIPYVTLRGLIEDPGVGNAAAGLLTADADGTLRLEGFRQQKSWDVPRTS